MGGSLPGPAPGTPATHDVVGSAIGHLVGQVGPGLLALLVLLAVARRLRLRWVPARRGAPRDPVRFFSRAQKAEILRRAGHRCEHVQGFSGRCDATTRLEADHVHPHSRGGWTSVKNGQALCRAHNKLKRADIPSNGDLRLLARRRLGYFPHGTSTAVTRFPPPSERPEPVAPAVMPLAALRVLGTGPTAVTHVPPIRAPRPGAGPEPHVRHFAVARPVEVLAEGTWWPGLQKAWRRDEHGGWMAEVGWFQGYGTGGGSRCATLPADLIRLPAEQAVRPR